jgi:hypothetical protein
MDTSSFYPYRYFLRTQGIDVVKGERDLRSLFGRPGEVYSIELRTIGVGTISALAKMRLIDGFGKGQSGFYVCASLDLPRVRKFSK